MSGLSNATFVGGLMRGYDFADRMKQRGLTRDRQERLDQRAEEELQMRKERHDLGLSDARRRRDREDVLASRQDQQWGRQQRLNKLADQEAYFKLLGRQASALEQNKDLLADMSDEEREAIANNPGINAQYLLSDETGQALDVAEGLIRGKHSLRPPAGADRDIVADSAQRLFPELVNDSQGNVKGVAGLYPGREKGTVVFELNDGTTQPKPMTENRSTDPEDPVKQIPVENVLNKVQGIKQLRQLLGSSAGRRYLMSMAGIKPSQSFSKLARDEDTGLVGQYDSSGQFHAQDMRKAGGSAGGRAPADVQFMEYLQKTLQVSPGEAFRMLKTAQSNPREFESKYVLDSLKAQRENSIEPGDDGYFTPEQLAEQAKQLSDQIYSASQRPTSSSAESPATANETFVQAATQRLQEMQRNGDPNFDAARAQFERETGQKFEPAADQEAPPPATDDSAGVEEPKPEMPLDETVIASRDMINRIDAELKSLIDSSGRTRGKKIGSLNRQKKEIERMLALLDRAQKSGGTIQVAPRMELSREEIQRHALARLAELTGQSQGQLVAGR